MYLSLFALFYLKGEVLGLETIYKNSNIPDDYKYIGNITSTYYDLFPYSSLVGKKGVCYRVFYSLSEEIFYTYDFDYTNSYYSNYSLIEVNTTNSILAKKDFSNICISSLSIILLILFICNLFTCIFKKNGILGGLL